MRKFFLSILPIISICFSLIAQNPNGVNFDGVDDYISTSILLDSVTFANWTIECWVKSPASPNATNFSGPMYGDNMGIIWNHVGPSYQGTATVKCGGTYRTASFGALLPNTWYHLAATFDGQELKAYKNGNLENQTTAPGGLNSAATPFTLGKHPSLTNFFNGTIDNANIWTVARSCTEINNAMNTNLLGTETGLYASYNFNQGIADDNNTSITTVLDATPSTNNATFNGFALLGTTSNIVNGAPFNNLVNNCTSNGLKLDGVNDHVLTPISLLDTLKFANWTYECLVKSPAAPTSNGFTGPMYGQNMGIIWDHTIAAYQGAATVQDRTGTFNAVSFGPLSPNTWYHLAATYDGLVLKAYKDGVLMSQVTTNGGLSESAVNLSLGRHPTIANYFNGTIDEVRVWTVARSCAEINSMMNSGLVGNEAGLEAYYNFDQGTTTTLTDQSSNGNDGTFQNIAFSGTNSNYVLTIVQPFALNCSVLAVDNIDAGLAESGIAIYPNPTNEQLNVEIEKLLGANVTLQLVDISGRTVLSEVATNQLTQLNISQLINGMYFLKVTNGSIQSIHKIMKL